MKMVRTTLFILVGLVILSACSSGKKGEQREKTEEQSNFQQVEKQKKDNPIILFFGNSITAGYGLSPEQAFPHLIELRLDSLGYDYEVVNAGLSGETTAGGVNRIDWVLKTVPDIFVLELGANDGLRGLDLDETKSNLIKIIDKVREANPDVKIILAGMMVPPNMGTPYSSQFQNLFKEVAKEKEVNLLPFILDRVAGIPEMNQSDGIHPTAEGQQLIAENVWGILQPLLEKQESL